ncbi:TerB family tellurite resistance protein [Mucilaginibacter sp. X4EP1]|uniref:TerB family tellurite resistance protein n=1 Tax=Mucilaginibacter sp. X4EP1 TaxID=2723092 RepID=UPI002168BC25|nr:TerB family tellurite resistance protein [Mucilaginibacter sp. X4EP1]MCS3815475.1 preprotein translocase subunit YajC [Mucilaginibacter sp. X4EP1]
MGSIKKCLLLCFMLSAFCFKQSHAQASTAQDVQQLLYDIEKLTQFKAILSDMQTGYTILTQGYGEVKDISEGNFNLHSAFLNSLEAISPAVRQYGRIADIIANQASIVTEYKNAWNQANASGHFSASELLYLNSVFTQLLSQSVDNLTNLTNILTANTLRMTDAERLQAIDHLYSDTQNKLTFLRGFNNQVAILSLQRAKEQNDIQMLNKLF